MEKLLIIQDKSTTVSHICKWCGAYWEAGCWSFKTAQDKQNQISWCRHAFYATVPVTSAMPRKNT